MKALVALSGGKDSATATYWCEDRGYDTSALHINFGETKNQIEAAKALCEDLDIDCYIMNMKPAPHYEDDRTTKGISGGIPCHRGLILGALTTWGLKLDVDIIVDATSKFNQGDWDSQPLYYDHYQKLLQLADPEEPQLDIRTPLANLENWQIILLGEEVGVPWEKTWSCVKENKDWIACNDCSKCRERKKAFLNAGVEDPLKYDPEGKLGVIEEWR